MPNDEKLQKIHIAYRAYNRSTVRRTTAKNKIYVMNFFCRYLTTQSLD